MTSHTDTYSNSLCIFICLTVWSNSKWICDLSIDSFAPRLWIKCFNYLWTDVRCSLECCMWCRPLSPGKLLPPPCSQPSTPTTSTTVPPAADALPPQLINVPAMKTGTSCVQLTHRYQLMQKLFLQLCICHSSQPVLLQLYPPEGQSCQAAQATVLDRKTYFICILYIHVTKLHIRWNLHFIIIFSKKSKQIFSLHMKILVKKKIVSLLILFVDW